MSTKLNIMKVYAQYFGIMAVTALLFASCYSTSYYSDADEDKASTSSYSFYDYRDGDKVQYKVYFKDDEISALYIDGKKVAKDDLHKYRNQIYDRLDLVSQGSVHRFRNNYHVNMDWLNDMMRDMNTNLKHNKIRVHIDKDKLKKEMEKMREDLKDIDVNIDFDKNQFKHDMQEMKKQLRRMKDDDFSFDMEEFNEKMQEFSEKMKDQNFAMRNFKVNIPPIEVPDVVIPEIPDIHIDMSGLEESMKELEKNMSNLNKEMKKLDAFMGDFKKELVKNKIIKDEDESFDMDYRDNGLEINGEKVPDSVFSKYKELYKKHFGREFDPHFRFRINGE